MKGSSGDLLVQHGKLNEQIPGIPVIQYTKLPNVGESLCATLLSGHPKAHYSRPCFAQPAPIGTHFRCSKNDFVIFLVGKQGPETAKEASYSS